MKNKIGLVLEGGGMRGAYTAGCLSWIIDEGLEFNGHYGISTGAIHLSSFLLKNKDYLFDISTKYIADKTSIGFASFFREGRIVSYDHLFNDVLDKQYGFDFDSLRKIKKTAKIGLYDMSLAETKYIDIQEVTREHLKAATSLPLLGKIVKINDKEYLDGGITKMIPIEESVLDGNTRNIIIATKPRSFIRKPAKSFVVWLMKMAYPNCRQIGEDYRIRHINYAKQMSIINDEVETGNAIYMCPSETVKVSRLSGDQETLEYLYELGRKDMEANKEKIYALFK